MWMKKELLSTCKDPIATTTLYFAVPVNNKKAATMLPAARKIKEHWPTAVQYAAAQQLRGQLGVLFPMRVAYGTKVYVLQDSPALDEVAPPVVVSFTTTSVLYDAPQTLNGLEDAEYQAKYLRDSHNERHTYNYDGNENPKQFLSAYTPQGAYKLNAVDQKYLESLQFPLAQVEEGAKLVALLVTVRDSEMQNMIIAHQEKTSALRQGSAEPDMWLLYEVGARIDQQPDGLILVYVENLLLYGPLWLVRAVSAAIRAVWKASELELLDADHVRFAPKELVIFTALEGENSGNEEEIKQAQKIALRIDLQRLYWRGEDFSVYTDSSFAPEGSRSHSGLVAVWLGAPVCWKVL
ncbi:unnamed protein product [Symbiodinium necroappetens]|uniref:Uncharacterized protein n=1 Tax=Symbiodinium necroappetens TaxID=1628268 RepID=A0A812VHA7_9DINO|nr:unnamed protein product [Symbiodinium necroappetens]